MRDRPDRIRTLQEFDKPILFLAGQKDAGIPSSTILNQASLSGHSEVHIIEGVAHMGMFENTEQTSLIIRDFAARCLA
jgi:pimeloyl-ACP methyl ester carboxylesterase